MRLVTSSGLPLGSVFLTLVSQLLCTFLPLPSSVNMNVWTNVIWGGRHDSLFYKAGANRGFASLSVWFFLTQFWVVPATERHTLYLLQSLRCVVQQGCHILRSNGF